MPPVATIGDSGKFLLAGAGRDSGLEGGNVHHLEDIILTCFLSRYAYARSFLGRIGTGVRLCVKPRLVSGEGIMINHCGVETHGIRKVEPPCLLRRRF